MTEEHEKWIESVDNALMDLRTINRDLGIENDSLRADNARLEAVRKKYYLALASLKAYVNSSRNVYLAGRILGGISSGEVDAILLTLNCVEEIVDSALSPSTDESEPTDD